MKVELRFCFVGLLISIHPPTFTLSFTHSLSLSLFLSFSPSLPLSLSPTLTQATGRSRWWRGWAVTTNRSTAEAGLGWLQNLLEAPHLQSTHLPPAHPHPVWVHWLPAGTRAVEASLNLFLKKNTFKTRLITIFKTLLITIFIPIPLL